MPRKAVSTRAAAPKEISVAAYTHVGRKRTNNPPVGLVSTATDSVGGVKKYQHDPHIDPNLSWAGKAEGTNFDVPVVSLHVHERIDSRRIIKSFLRERTGLKQQSLFEYIENQLPLNKAVEFYSHDQDWSNRLIAGDSLLVMNSLLEKEGMEGHLQMVYFDPPYGIKYNSNFQPFVNRRDVKDGSDEGLSSEPEMIKAFRDTWELGIHSYLTYLRDRVQLIKSLLHETGSCFLQINDENVHHVREIMDEVFGKDNFISMIAFSKAAGGLEAANRVGSRLDYIVWYAKNAERMKYRPVFEERGGPVEEGYTMVELADGERRNLTPEEKKNIKLLPKGSKLFSTVLMTKPGPGSKFDVEFKGRKYDSGSRWWGTTKEGIEKIISAGRIWATENSIRFVKYFDDFPYKTLSNLWEGFGGAANPIYVVQTNTEIIRRCMLLTTDPGDLVFDPTCGSGSTAYTAELFGRRWMACDTSRVAIALAKQRMMTAAFPYFALKKPEEGLQSGFIYKTYPRITMASVANNAPPHEETLYDQPKVEKEKVRAAGPFTVEAVPSLRTKPFDSKERNSSITGNAVARAGETANYAHWCDELKASGIRATGGHFLQFSRIEPLSGTKWLHAEGEILDSVGQPKKAYISFGPDFGPLEQRQVEQAVNEAVGMQEKPNFLIFAAFHFDPEAAKDIDQMKFGAGDITILKAQMSVDLLTEDLRKKRSSNQSFWLIGQPDVEIMPEKNGTFKVVVKGFDYYNPVSGEIDSGGASKIAMWMLDTDYDEQSLLPDQVFFPMQDSSRDWTKLAKSLNGAVNEELMEAFTGIESLPFSPGTNRKIAVKIIDDRGIESFVVKSL